MKLTLIKVFYATLQLLLNLWLMWPSDSHEPFRTQQRTTVCWYVKYNQPFLEKFSQIFKKYPQYEQKYFRFLQMEDVIPTPIPVLHGLSVRSLQQHTLPQVLHLPPGVLQELCCLTFHEKAMRCMCWQERKTTLVCVHDSLVLNLQRQQLSTDRRNFSMNPPVSHYNAHKTQHLLQTDPRAARTAAPQQQQDIPCLVHAGLRAVLPSRFMPACRHLR